MKYPEQRSIPGRLLYWDHLQDQLSYLLCPTEEGDEPTPDPKATFGTALKNKDPGHPIDLDMDDMVVPEEKPEEKEEEIDVHLLLSFSR